MSRYAVYYLGELVGVFKRQIEAYNYIKQQGEPLQKYYDVLRFKRDDIPPEKILF